MEEAWELAAVRVFLSWSGEHSRAVASEFATWLPCVFQEIETFLSSDDISAGERWSNVLSEALGGIDFGISFVNVENKERPWLLFEAGALGKNPNIAKVIPVLIDLQPIDLVGSPLTEFQCVSMNKDGVRRLLFSILDSHQTTTVSVNTLQKCFEVWWPALWEKLEALEPPKPKKGKGKVSPDDRLDRIETALSQLLSQRSSDYSSRRSFGNKLGASHGLLNISEGSSEESTDDLRLLIGNGAGFESVERFIENAETLQSLLNISSKLPDRTPNNSNNLDLLLAKIEIAKKKVSK